MNSRHAIQFIGMIRNVRSFSRLTQVRNYTEEGQVYDHEDDLSNYIACPLSKQELYQKSSKILISERMGVVYRVEDGIPNLIPVRGKLLKDNPLSRGEFIGNKLFQKPTDETIKELD